MLNPMNGTFQKKLHLTDADWQDIKESEARFAASAFNSPKSKVDEVMYEMQYFGFVFKTVFADYRFKKEGGD